MELTAGLEVHQQLACGKLFCGCPGELATAQTTVFHRCLHVTASEMGEVDLAAVAEGVRRFAYHRGDSDCLVEADEEPPRGPNSAAVEIALQLAGLLGAEPVDELHFMRKVVVDGSNTTGFQRTALLATGGRLAYDGGEVEIEQLCLEEDACRRGEGADHYLLDRLGIPLIEITTAPQLHTPQQVQEAARALGRLLRACRVKRGLGTIRQDVNVSIPAGTRVELKGFQDLRTMGTVVTHEMARQAALATISATTPGPVVEVTDHLADRGPAWACRLPGWAGLLGSADSPAGHPRLGRELADHATRAGVKGLMHSDELPAYDISAEETAAMARAVGCKKTDAFILVFGKRDLAEAALALACARVMEGGVPREVRRVTPAGGSRYLRPMPGAARMYPETDIPPLALGHSALARVTLPPTLAEREAALPLGPEEARQLVAADLDARFHALAAVGDARVVARLLLHQLPEAAREGLADPGDDALAELVAAVADGRLAKEGVAAGLAALARGKPLPLSGGDTTAELEEFIAALLREREAFVRERGLAAVGPLMGAVMGEFRGRIDGAKINAKLKAMVEALNDDH